MKTEFSNFARTSRQRLAVRILLAAASLALLLLPNARGQWLTQSIVLRPGWNAVYLHVNATYDSLENLTGATSPIAEIWLWQPSAQGLISNNPQAPSSGNDWMHWTRAEGPANAFPLLANTTYLVRNNGGTDFTWTLKGNPVPPRHEWTASGLNFFGFSTRGDTAPLFSNFLAPALAGNAFQIFHYPGGEAVDAPPTTAPLFTLNSTRVTRGRAVWIRRTDNPDNRYFGPFQALLQDYRGVLFSDSLGQYSLRLRNHTTQSNTVTATLLDSETSPGGEAIPAPPLLLRTTLDMATLKYSYETMPVNQAKSFVLAPKGFPGSEVEIVLGLDRAIMTGTNGAPFAGILRLNDTTLGHLQVDVPVSAKQASTDGLWVGTARINQVGNYLKAYAKATNSADFASQLSQLEALNEANKYVDFGTNEWSASTETASWSAVASSAGGTNLAAAAFGGGIYTSDDGGTNWTVRIAAPETNWVAMASSADGTNLVAVVDGGQIYTSADFGAAWTQQSFSPVANWKAVASSADGTKLAAAASGGDIYTSDNFGQSWTQRTPLALTSQNWQAIASSADGEKLVAAIKGGQIYASTNSGATWAVLFGAPTADWQALASSADGKKLVAAANPGAIYTSENSGATWDLRASAPPNAAWAALASSANGNALVAAVNGDRIYTSSDGGTSWTARENTRGWAAVASTGDGGQILAAESGAAGQLYMLRGELKTPTLVYDLASSRILSDGKYLTASFDTELGSVPQPFPLRLIVHNGSNGTTRLLQKVFVGMDAVTTNAILTRQEADLHPAYLAKARRISAVHLPLAADGWALSGEFGGVGIMNAVLNEGYNSQGSNPFVHSYHPDHDNLDALFQPITKAGTESYDLKRQITLSFTPPADDFLSRTASSSTLQGTYLENIVLKGSDNQTRTVVTKGSFVLNRISSIAALK